MILLRHGQSEFNVVFAETRQDPGIVDPALTPLGREQARAAAAELAAYGVRRIIVSPYTRALQTCEEVLRELDVPVAVEPLVGERAWFKCDVGSPRSDLAARWPQFAFDHIAEKWWPDSEEDRQLLARCERFHADIRVAPDWGEVAVISHWGFIRGLTGETVTNCQTVVFDPTAVDGPHGLMAAAG